MTEMTSFVEQCVETATDSAVSAAKQSRGRPKAKRLLRRLAGKKNILVTTHLHPDPDALASCLGLVTLLRQKLTDAKVHLSVKGRLGGGVNQKFADLVGLNSSNQLPWDEQKLGDFDAIILLDTQPLSAASPLPTTFEPFAVIDHHRGKFSRPHCPFCDIRTDVGATSSIIFSYMMELEIDITPGMGASLLFAIETDLAGAAGTPGELDNLALSSLTLIADTRKLYEMRYVDLPQAYYVAYAEALDTAMYFENALIAHLKNIDSPEKPAVMADFLLRFDQVQWAMVTAVYENNLVISLRTSSSKLSASQMLRRLLRNWGEGGGHRTKAGGFIALSSGTPAELARYRDVLRRRYLRALKIRTTRGQRLVPKTDTPAKSA